MNPGLINYQKQNLSRTCFLLLCCFFFFKLQVGADMGTYPLECELHGDRPLFAALSRDLGNVSYKQGSLRSFPINDKYLLGPFSSSNKKTQANCFAEHPALVEHETNVVFYYYY